MERLSYEEIKEKSNGTKVQLEGYISAFNFETSKKGVKSITGTIHFGKEMPFRVWTGKLYDEIKDGLSQGVYIIDATVNIYNESMSLILDKLEWSSNQDLSCFLAKNYNKEELWNKMVGYAKELTPKGRKVFKELMLSNDFSDEAKNSKLFLTATASVTHHDACISGLLAHTVKVTNIALTLYEQYPKLKSRINKDVLILGCIFHDITKMMEYENFSMSGVGELCSHLSLNVEFLMLHRDLIVDELGTEAYYRLESVLTQHHGQYGDRPRTFEAYLVHKADMLEATLQGVEESIEEDTGATNIRDGEMYLRLY